VSLRDVWRAYLGRRYTLLFYTLLFTLFAAPALATFQREPLIEVLFIVSLLAAVVPLATGPRRVLVVAVTAVACLAHPIAAWLDHPTIAAVALGMWTLIALFAAAGALRFASGAGTVSAEHLYAALSAYLLAGIFFGVFYWTLEQTAPGSFGGTDGSRASAIYFSFVTLATLGYGDIVPRSDVARGLVIVEAVGGQLFLAVLVARLVSGYSKR
jgi:hypothetical protein